VTPAPPLVPWLLTLGLAVVTFAGAWHVLEAAAREEDPPRALS
jgi:hypothetical protein